VSSFVLHFDFKGSLASSTPSFQTALDIRIERVLYDAEGQSQLAFDRYQLALETIIPLLNSKEEPKGRRRDLLHQQVILFRKHLVITFFCLKNNKYEKKRAKVKN